MQKKYIRRAKYGILKRRKAKQKVLSFEAWWLAFVQPFPNLAQNKPHKKVINGVLVQCGFEEDAFSIFNINKERDNQDILSEWEEYQYAYNQLKSLYPYGFDVYSKN